MCKFFSIFASLLLVTQLSFAAPPFYTQHNLISDDTTLIPPIARRLGPTTPVLYPILESIPFLRSHLIGRLRCPT